MIDRLPMLAIVKLWNRGSSDWLVEAFMDCSSQQVLFTKYISWLNAFVDLDMISSWGMSRYLSLLPDSW